MTLVFFSYGLDRIVEPVEKLPLKAKLQRMDSLGISFY